MTYGQLLILILPVFAMIALGVVLRRIHWVEGEAETSLLRLVIYVCFPCLVFESVLSNVELQQPGNLLGAPLVGFGTTVASIGIAWLAGRSLGLTIGTGLRTFALAAGLGNYGYLPLPIMTGLFGPESRGLLLVHNVGVEFALWTVGVIVLSGLSIREGWRKLLSPMVLTLLGAVLINLTGLGPRVPVMVMEFVGALAACAVPLGLLMTGANLANYLGEPKALFEPRVSLGSAALRLAILPLAFLALARWLPVPLELKRVIVVQGAMPAAVIPIILAQHYGGRPLTAVQIVLGTTALGVLLTPLWLRAGFAWAL